MGFPHLLSWIHLSPVHQSQILHFQALPLLLLYLGHLMKPSCWIFLCWVNPTLNSLFCFWTSMHRHDLAFSHLIQTYPRLCRGSFKENFQEVKIILTCFFHSSMEAVRIIFFYCLTSVGRPFMSRPNFLLYMLYF